MEEATVTSKGQITIPKPIREQLHLGTGSKVLFIQEDRRIVLQLKAKNAFQGLLALRKSLKQQGKLFSAKELEALRQQGKREWSKYA